MAPGRRQRRASERALISLRRMILCGELAAGERLYEAQLSDRLGLSRTPLREALARIAEEGLLEPAGEVGWRVRAFTRRDIADAIELRGTLEGLAVRLAAERGADDHEIGRARAAAAELDAVIGVAQGIDIDAYAAANARFHDAIARSCGGDVVARHVARACRLPFASPSAFLHARAGLSDFEASLILAQSHHHAILRAVDAGEGARAEALAREHARIARDNLDRALVQAARSGTAPPGLRQITT